MQLLRIAKKNIEYIWNIIAWTVLASIIQWKEYTGNASTIL